MMHAYDEKYLNDAMENLGEMLDYAVNACHFEGDEFWDLFLASGMASTFGKGEPRIISGTSGTELALEILDHSGIRIDLPRPQEEYSYSPEYWAGRILAYYQWYTGRNFKDLKKHLDIADILKLYPTLHEASENKFIDVVNEIIRSANPPTRLKEIRNRCGYSQKELAEKSGVNIRMIQQYEIGAKDINKAAAVTLVALSRAMGCQVEELLEYENPSK